MKTNRDLFEAARLVLAFLVAFIVGVTMPVEIHAAALRLEWVRVASSPSDRLYSFGTGIAATGSGDVYVVGSYITETITFGDFTLINPGGAGGGAVFLAKYDRDGTAVWVRQFGSAADFGFGDSIAIDQVGNIYIAGGLGTSAFVAKYSDSGGRQWIRQALSSDSNVSGKAVALDSAGNIYLVGYFHRYLDFGTTNLLNNGTSDLSDLEAFIAKFNPNGNLLWARNAGGQQRDLAYGLAVDERGFAYVTGFYNSTNAVFGSVSLTNYTGYACVFVAKYDPSGNVLWAKSAGHHDPAWGNGVGFDSVGNCYVVGQFGGTNSFGPTNLVSNGAFDLFLAKYSATGEFIWARQAGGPGYDSARGIVVDPIGNSYLTGDFEESAFFSEISLSSRSGPEIFWAKYDADGNLLWAEQADGNGYSDGGLGIATDTAGNIYLTGGFAGTNRVDGTNIVSDGYAEVFVAKYAEAPLLEIPLKITTQPLSQAVVAGTNFTLVVTADGTPPLSFRWRYNGLDIPGAVAAALTLSNVQPANAGEYTVVVSDSYGSITSSIATLTVNFSLTVMKKGVGSVSIVPDQPGYTPGSVVNVRAAPSFLSWSGGASGTDNPLMVTMTSNLVIIANFAGPALTPLGNLPGGFDSEANAISADGSTVVGFASAAGPYHAFRWTESTGIADLGSLPGGESHARFANAVSGDGGVVVGYSRYDDNRTDQAFRWTSREGMVGIGFFPGRFRSYAWGISADGNVIVGSGESSQGDLAFRWTLSEGIRGLGSVTGSDFRSIAYSASSNGAVIVGASQTGGVGGATLWTLSGGTLVLGHISNGVAALAWDISPDGKFVVGADQLGGSEIRSEAFRWSSNGGFRTLGHIAGQLQNYAGLSVSADGEVIVGTEGDEAFIWTPGLGMRRLWDALISVGVNPGANGWSQLSGARGVSDDGRFVCGYGQRGGRRQAFRADLLPAGVPLTVRTNGNGSVARSPDQSTYPANSGVSLTAIPGPGAYFVNWSGDATGILNPISVTMTRGKSITANFAATKLTLLTQGYGRIAKSPDREYYDLGEDVTLSALPGPWHVFTRWSDGSTINPRIITIRPSNLYAAVFSPTSTVETLTFSNISRTAPVGMPAIFVNGEFVVTNTVSRLDAATVSMLTSFPNGIIFYTLDGSTPDFGANLYSGPISLNRTVTLRAVAYDASFLKSWEVDPLLVHIEPTYTLNAWTAGGGSVGLMPLLPPGSSYRSNTVINLTAFADPGWTFLQWLGDASGTNASTSIRVMNRDLCVQALFGTTLETFVAGNGSVIVNPPAPFYPYGTVVRLSAVPEPGNYFGAWGNAAMSTNNPLLITMTNANPTVSSVFGPLSAGQLALTVLVNGHGKVTTTPGGHRFPAGQSIRLSAIADADQEFLGWTGDLTGASTNLTVTLTQSKIISAQFTKRPRLSLGPCEGGWREDGFQLLLTGEIGGRYLIETANELPLWSPLAHLTNTYGVWQMVNPAATNSATQFYRAVAEP